MDIHHKPVVAVFCGSKGGANTQFLEDAAALGKQLAINGFEIVYGGSSLGLMGAVAKNAIKCGGRVTGVLPEVLLSREPEFKELTDFIVAKDMHVRKKTMYEMCDAAIILPGGFGTLDELFEMLTWNQLSIHDKKIFILNTAGFYTHLIKHLETLQTSGFLYEPIWTRLSHFEQPIELVEAIRQELGAA